MTDKNGKVTLPPGDHYSIYGLWWWGETATNQFAKRIGMVMDPQQLRRKEKRVFFHKPPPINDYWFHKETKSKKKNLWLTVLPCPSHHPKKASHLSFLSSPQFHLICSDSLIDTITCLFVLKMDLWDRKSVV